MKKSFIAVTSSWDSSPWPANGRRAHQPAGTVGVSGRSPAVGTYDGWVTSYGVCGHLLDSLSACDHSVTLMKPEQARFGSFWGPYVFSEGFASDRRIEEGVTRISAGAGVQHPDGTPCDPVIPYNAQHCTVLPALRSRTRGEYRCLL